MARSRGARARAAFDLAIVSVLLDAGAGPRLALPRSGDAARRSAAPKGWRSPASTCSRAARSRPIRADPLRVDAAVLAAPDAPTTSRAASRCRDDNPLVGLDGRAALLRRLGATVVARSPDVFGARRHAAARRPVRSSRRARPTTDACRRRPSCRSCCTHLGPIWPSRLTLGGVALGDCWRHPALTTDDATNGLVPLHKLSQWLAYSLIEPLQRAGIEVTDIDGLTGLAEYRNGGLFVDTGVLALRDPGRRRSASTTSARRSSSNGAR